ncbi:MAG: methionine synthase [Candidatus Eremiobacteraeota bacterium]|nr:methionine synthase [Candidatus Eremiobacteraeota bacterium]
MQRLPEIASLYPTTIAGSLPKPAWLAEPERLWPQWRLEGAALESAEQDATRIAVFEQQRAGIDAVTDGEQSRQHFVHGFLTGIENVDFSRKVRRGIRADRYEADCPTITGPVRRRGPVPIHGREVEFARSLTDGALKVTLPGPMTIVDTLHDAHYRDREAAARAFATLLNEEARELVDAGAGIVQLDEPAFNVYFDEVEAWGIAALDTALHGIDAIKAVHVCYGYGIEANIRWKTSLGLEWDQYARIFPLLSQSSVDQVSLELAGSRVPPEVLSLLGNKDAAIGVIDVATDRVETPEEVAATIELARARLPAERIWCSTNCGMAPMKREVAYAKLQALGAGARLARAQAAVASVTAT